jgi:hypothetical protein
MGWGLSTAFYFSSTHHDSQNSDKDSNKISEKKQCMFHIVQITTICFLNYLLRVHHREAYEHQKPKIQLQIVINKKTQSKRTAARSHLLFQ